jgi:hypothetical protein
MSYQGYPQTNQIRFTTSSPLMITSYALISVANFLFVSQHIFSTDSRIKEGTEIGLFTAALALTAINMMILLYIKSRKMPKQGISLGVFARKTLNFGPLMFTIFQIILMALLIALFILSNTTLSTSSKVFIIMTLTILNIGQILTVWSFSSTYCGSFNPMQQRMMGQQYGQQQYQNNDIDPSTGRPYGQ